MELCKYEGNFNVEPLTKIMVAKASCNSESVNLKFLMLSDANSQIEVYKLDAPKSKVNSLLVGTDVSQEGFKKIGTISLSNEDGLQACAFEFRVTGENFAIALSSSSKFSVLNPMLEESDGQILQDEESTALEPTDLEILMQAQADAELRDFEIQQGQELLAQQMADIELAVLGGAV